MKIGKFLSTLVGMSLLVSALAFGFLPDKPKPLPSKVPEAVVRVGSVESVSTRRQVRFSGIIRASREAVLSFAVSGRMVNRPAEIGDRVAGGDVLARLDVREFENAEAVAVAAEAEMRIRLTQARRDRDRMESLVRTRAAATQELERATSAADALEAGLLAAAARIREARRIRSEAELKAPFAGTVTAVHLEPGEWATPGQPVVALSGTGDLELEVEVPEGVIGRLREGDDVEAVLPLMGGRRVYGTVTSVTQAAPDRGRLFPVLVSLDTAQGLTAGLTAELILEVETRPRLLVPASAVVNPGSSRPTVFVVENGRVREVAVETGPFYGKRVTVSGGLRSGDRVVVSGNASLSDGKRVEVRS